MKCVPFAVVDEPYCVWEFNVPKRNIQFLKSLDPDYFLYIVGTNVDALEDEEDHHRAAMAIRMAYYQALEMFFSLACAWIQAPKCIYAWLEIAKTGDLRRLVRKVTENHSFPLMLAKPSANNLSWLAFAKAVFTHIPESEKKEGNIKGFSGAWARFSHDFLDPNNIAEYNALKHGARISSGGFTLAVGIEDQPGKAVPIEKCSVVGHSKWGSGFYKLEKLGPAEKSNRSYRSQKAVLNWTATSTAARVQLLAVSIHNLIGAILITNQVKPSTIKFSTFNDVSCFKEPWSSSVGVPNATIDFDIPNNENFKRTKKQLLSAFPKNDL